MITHKPSLFLWSIKATLIILAAFLVTGVTLVLANGGATLVSSQVSGPYQIDFSIIPGKAVAHNTHVSILIFAAETRQVITNATVNLTATGPEGATSIGPVDAPNDITPQFYEVNLPFDTAGNWQVMVSVTSDRGQAQVSVPLEVNEGGNNINWILVATVAVAIVAAGVFIWDRIGSGRRGTSGSSET